MMNRTTTSAAAGRSSSIRRLRRRAGGAGSRPYCGTNGCASFLEVDGPAATARCAICGYTRRID